MKKRFLTLILAIMSLAMLRPLPVRATTPPDSDVEASLTLHYQKDETAFTDLSLGIYRIAEVLPSGSYQLIDPYASYPIYIHSITSQEQWQHIAQTLYSYIVADGIAPDREAKTDSNGSVCFSDLPTGLYFVREVTAENTDGTYIFNQFLIYVPTPQPDGTYNYIVEAKPKCTSFVPKSQYTVTKLWQDAGNQHLRPQEVTIDIYRDGVLYETQLLNAANDWTYTWYVSKEDPGKWTVTERSFADLYDVTIQQNGSHFSIINTYQITPEPPQTGDSFTPLPWILGICCSGMILLLLGIYKWRQR